MCIHRAHFDQYNSRIGTPGNNIILIVDDNAETRQMTRSFLRDLPFEFEECIDGVDALACYEKICPEWVLMDWEMGKIKGLTATRRIIAAYPDARILMLTQYGDKELRDAAIEAGAKGFVMKDNLIALRSFLEKS
jgi:CheY-like chemotaxis protein